MDALLEHLRAHVVAYVVLVICLIPLLYITRKFSVPVILYAAEVALYCAILHIILWAIVGGFAWFKESSSMQRAFETGQEKVNWGIPLLQFWERDAYKPKWVHVLEIFLALGIVWAVWRFRPMQIQRGPRRKAARERLEQQKRLEAARRARARQKKKA